MSSPDIVVLDTREATDKASFLAAAARHLKFPDYFGGNWDAFEECARDFAEANRPVLVVWTGATTVPDDVRDTAIDLFSTSFPDGADVLIVDDVSATAPPNFAVYQERIGIPLNGLAASQAFFKAIGFNVADDYCEADAITIQLVPEPHFRPGIGPMIQIADIMKLVSDLSAGGYAFTETATGLDVPDPHGNLLSFIYFGGTG